MSVSLRSRYECWGVSAAWVLDISADEDVIAVTSYIRDDGTVSSGLKNCVLFARYEGAFWDGVSEHWFPLDCPMLLIWDEVEL